VATIDRDVWPKSVAPKKLAVVIAGAGSLGSYEAGVLTELWYALETLNTARETLADGSLEGPFVVDVLTGASAGGMTAAMTARSILYEADQRARIHSAWVREVTMKALLEEEPTQGGALFSKKIVGDIAGRHLDGPLQGAGASASFAPDVLRLGMTLTNLNGLDYELFTRSLTASGPGFLTTRFSDRALFTLKKDGFADVPWPAIKESAIATGNFPLAFMPQGLMRQRADYMSENPALQVRPAVPPARDYFPHAFACIDGGMFDNQPLGLAINFAAEADGGQVDPERLFLLVHPNISHSAHDDKTGAGVGYLSDALGLGDQIKRLLQMLMTENAVSDWVRAQRVNELVTWRDGFVRQITDIIAATKVADAPRLVTNLTSIAMGIARRRAPDRPDAYLAAYRERIADREGAFYARLGGPQPAETLGQQVFVLLLFVLDHLSELQDKQAVWLEVIGHDEALPLAGAGVNGFAGFFLEEWRAYDYRRGRLDTWNAFTGTGGSGFGLLGDYPKEPRATQPSRPAPADPDEYTVDLGVWRNRLGTPNFPAVTFDDIPKDLRDKFVDRVADRAKALLGISGVTGVAFNLFVKPKIAKFLAGKPS
jgi:hypothetical protein